MLKSIYNSKLLIYLSLMLLIPFLPIFRSIDPIGAQWFYLSVLNFCSIIIIKDHHFPKLESNFICYLIFFAFSLFSTFFSNNLPSSIIDISRLFLIIISAYILVKFSKNQSVIHTLNNFSVLISIFLFFEVLYCIWPYFIKIYYQFSGQNVLITTNELLGLAGNKNITSASIVIKLPFLFFSFNKQKLNPFLILLFLLGSISIMLLLSRASYISYFLLLFFLLLFYVIYKHYIKVAVLIIIPTISYVITNVLFPLNSQSLVSQVKSIGFNKTSSNWRFELWSNVLDYFTNQPLKPVGIGNWKIESLPYWKLNLEGYLVPYHAHNDFLQYLVEIGAFGVIFFLLFFTLTFLFLIKQVLFNKFEFKQFSLILISVVTSLFIDTFLNFPHERLIIQLNTVLILFLSYFLSKQTKNHV